MKYKSRLLFAVLGGILGFVFHFIWHFNLDIKLISFAPHNIWGVIHIAIGIIIGLGLWYLLNRK